MKKYLLLGFIWAVPVVAQELVLEEVSMDAEESKPMASVLSFGQEKRPVQEGTLDELYQLLDNQTKNLKELTERLEQTEHRLQLTEAKLDRVNQDLAFRLGELETKKLEDPVVIDKKSDKERYEYAYNLLKKQDYSQAEKEFLGFIKDFEQSDLIANAIYWLGETYYVQGHYEQAVGRFADVFTKYADSNKAPDAFLKMGLSMLSLNKKAEACTAFVAFPNEYPKADEALKKRAQEEVNKNQCS